MADATFVLDKVRGVVHLHDEGIPVTPYTYGILNIMKRLWLHQQHEGQGVDDYINSRYYSTGFHIGTGHQSEVRALYQHGYILCPSSAVPMHDWREMKTDLARLTATGRRWIEANYQKATIETLEAIPSGCIDARRDDMLQLIYRDLVAGGVCTLAGNADLTPYIVDDLIADGFIVTANAVQSRTTPLLLTAAGLAYIKKYMLPMVMEVGMVNHDLIVQ